MSDFSGSPQLKDKPLSKSATVMKMTKTSAAEPQSLQALYTRPGFIIRRAGIDQISLGALIGADRSTVASVVRPLDDGGLVARCLVSNDRRPKQLMLPRAPVEPPGLPCCVAGRRVAERRGAPGTAYSRREERARLTGRQETDDGI